MHSHSSPHHSHSAKPDTKNQRKIVIAAVLTFSYMLVEVIGGFWVNSVALIADGMHMLTDSIALMIAWWGFHIAQKPATERMTFGYMRAQILTAFVNGAALLLISVGITAMAIERMFNPQEVMGAEMFMIAIIGLGINLTVFVMLHSGDQKNLNMRGATLHFMGDTLASVAVISAAIIIYFSGWNIVDPILSILVASIIAYNAFKLTRSAATILLEGVPAGYEIQAIKDDLAERFPYLEEIHHIHLWAIAEQQVMMTLHAKTDLAHINDATLFEIKSYLNDRHAVHHVTLQLETM
ncbi:MAG: cation transporter [Thiomicrospira sp.]|uniref:cation diffusion facilitator family transporter n=1 Tax=Thiomicrospira sp. TaxID=935 RepID=UPI0019DB866C|nr:cation diffusion facilitator family transporter [Thiomicrospira sp.]MBE0493031.1 cation transporter [Thiomicrospira sp.]